MRQLVFSSGSLAGFLAVRTEIAILFGLSIAFIWAAGYWLARMEQFAVQEGTLTDRRR
jgi:hypothetical protein